VFGACEADFGRPFGVREAALARSLAARGGDFGLGSEFASADSGLGDALHRSRVAHDSGAGASRRALY
jgi:hypothetical protein